MSESGCPENLPLKPFMMKILANRRPERIAELAKKLNTEGIKQKTSLKVLTKNIIETQLFKKNEAWRNCGRAESVESSAKESQRQKQSITFEKNFPSNFKVREKKA